MEKPGARVVSAHIDYFHAGGQQLNDIRAMALVEHRIAVPVWSMQIGIIP